MIEPYHLAVLQVGKFALCRYPDGGIYIRRCDQDREGEGGRFDEAALEKVIAEFYAENF